MYRGYIRGRCIGEGRDGVPSQISFQNLKGKFHLKIFINFFSFIYCIIYSLIMNWVIDLLIYNEECNKKILKIVIVILSIIYIGSFIVLVKGGLK